VRSGSGISMGQLAHLNEVEPPRWGNRLLQFG
jgi:hypothetical protein